MKITEEITQIVDQLNFDGLTPAEVKKIVHITLLEFALNHLNQPDKKELKSFSTSLFGGGSASASTPASTPDHVPVHASGFGLGPVPHSLFGGTSASTPVHASGFGPVHHSLFGGGSVSRPPVFPSVSYHNGFGHQMTTPTTSVPTSAFGPSHHRYPFDSSITSLSTMREAGFAPAPDSKQTPPTPFVPKVEKPDDPVHVDQEETSS